VWQRLSALVNESHVARQPFENYMAPKPTSPPATAVNPLQTLWKAYNDNTPNRLKFIDAFLLFLMLSGIIQFAYCILVSNYPYNAFLSGYVVATYPSQFSHTSSVSQVPSVNSYWSPHYVHKSTQKTGTSSKTYHQNGMCIMVMYMYMSANVTSTYAVRLQTLQ